MKILVTWEPGNNTPTFQRILRNACTLLSEYTVPYPTSRQSSLQCLSRSSAFTCQRLRCPVVISAAQQITKAVKQSIQRLIFYIFEAHTVHFVLFIIHNNKCTNIRHSYIFRHFNSTPMFVSICQCLSVFVSVCQYLSVFVSVCQCFQCLSVFVSFCQCLSVFVSVCQCLSVFVRVCQYLSGFVSVCQCLSVFVSVCQCFRTILREF
jgi:hypothetical protein